MRRFRLPAIFCALALLVAELVSRPFAAMGVCDDWSYFITADTLARTGHVVYNGWATAILGWQLYFGAALIRIFGSSYTTVRMGTVLVAMVSAFLLQRVMVRAGIAERNATLGTTAVFLSPLFVELSATYMSDIYGIFVIIVCLYGCLRALQAADSHRALLWILFAVVTNALGGTARQVAWLGLLVMVPSTLWLLRAHRRVVMVGAGACVAGAIFLFGCMLWFKHQPYSVGSLPADMFTRALPLHRIIRQFSHVFLDVPFLLLPLVAIYLLELRRAGRRVLAVLSAIAVLYAALAFYHRSPQPDYLLLPTQGDWVTFHGIFDGVIIKGVPPVWLPTPVHVLLTVVCIGGVLGLAASILAARTSPPAARNPSRISFRQLLILLLPFTVAYAVLLLPNATVTLFDRYMLGPVVAGAIVLVRFYQDRVRPQLPVATQVLVAIMAIAAIAITHNTFAFDRARVALVMELRAAGIPGTAIDAGWEYNMQEELQHAPAVVYTFAEVSAAPPPAIAAPLAETCSAYWADRTPHLHARYGISFDPDVCAGLAPFAPVRYSRWLASGPGTLYAVKYTQNATP